MARVLLVDDDADIRYVAALVLRRARHEVTVADGAAQALAFFETGGACDVVLCDRMMPMMNGLQLFAAIRKREMRQPRFVFLSAKAQQSEIDEALRLGADGYLLKPFEPKKLLAEIERLAGTRA